MNSRLLSSENEDSTQSAELEIKSQPKRYLDAENLELYREKMQRTYTLVLEGTEHLGYSKAEIKHN